MENLTVIAKQMIQEAKDHGWSYRCLRRGLELKMKFMGDAIPPYNYLKMARRTYGGPWPDNLAKEEKIIRQVFDVPKRASRTEDERAGAGADYHVVGFGWPEAAEQPVLI